jgi:hypothetical protein
MDDGLPPSLPNRQHPRHLHGECAGVLALDLSETDFLSGTRAVSGDRCALVLSGGIHIAFIGIGMRQ